MEDLTNLYLITTIDIFGDAIIELRESKLTVEELNEMQDDYFSHVGSLDEEDANKMQSLNLDPANEKDCINYAKNIKNLPVPDKYNLIVLPPEKA